MKTYYQSRVRAAHVFRHLVQQGPASVQGIATALRAHRPDKDCQIPGCETIEWWSVYESSVYSSLRRMETLGLVSRTVREFAAHQWRALPGKHYMEPLMRPEAIDMIDVRESLLTIRGRLHGAARTA